MHKRSDRRLTAVQVWTPTVRGLHYFWAGVFPAETVQRVMFALGNPTSSGVIAHVHVLTMMPGAGTGYDYGVVYRCAYGHSGGGLVVGAPRRTGQGASSLVARVRSTEIVGTGEYELITGFVVGIPYKDGRVPICVDLTPGQAIEVRGEASGYAGVISVETTEVPLSHDGRGSGGLGVD